MKSVINISFGHFRRNEIQILLTSAQMQKERLTRNADEAKQIVKLYSFLFKIHFLSSCISQTESPGFYNSGTSISLPGYSDGLQLLFLAIKDSANFYVSNLVNRV